MCLSVYALSSRARVIPYYTAMIYFCLFAFSCSPAHTHTPHTPHIHTHTHTPHTYTHTISRRKDGRCLFSSLLAATHTHKQAPTYCLGGKTPANTQTHTHTDTLNAHTHTHTHLLPRGKDVGKNTHTHTQIHTPAKTHTQIHSILTHTHPPTA